MFVDGKQMHIALQKGDVGRYVIVPGARPFPCRQS